MTYQLWCQVKAEDARREAEKYRLIKIAAQQRKNDNQQRAVKQAFRFGLAKAS